ncbi:MAG TPA: hypothetical protein VLJ10_01690 [Candidatus Bathyarchaeia archaeon]|nr:hypothetical protein [Candidatus Bathyarchaeia archaeon]
MNSILDIPPLTTNSTTKISNKRKNTLIKMDMAGKNEEREGKSLPFYLVAPMVVAERQPLLRSSSIGGAQSPDLNGFGRASTTSSPALYKAGSVAASLRSCRVQRNGIY